MHDIICLCAVPVKSLAIKSISPSDTEEAVSEGGIVKLKEGDNMGVVCVADTDGSAQGPALAIYMDGQDKTSSFTVSNTSDTTELTEDHLGVSTSQKRAEYRTTMPEADFNERNMTCVATKDGFPDVVASVLMSVECKYEKLFICIYSSFDVKQDQM